MEHSNTIILTVVVAMSAGVLIIATARRLDVSAVVLLLGGGVLLGPEVAGVVRPGELGQGLQAIVSIAIALILFEGGLTLDPRHYRSAPIFIRRLLSVGVLVTWLGTAAILWALLGFAPVFCLLAASLVIVTGPTVIGPLLRRIKVVPKIHGILHWEGVLIDPVGVFIAILCFEWLVASDSEVVVLSRFLGRFVWGLGLGVLSGLAIDRLLRGRWIPGDMVNVAALGGAVLVYGIAEMVFTESGLLAVTVGGLVLGLRKPVELQRIRQFKAEITDLLIGTLFILLAAKLDLSRFAEFGWRGLLAVLALMVVVRPVAVHLCAIGRGLDWRERLFLAWVAPRGIVAASMASLFALGLQDVGHPDAAFLETFTYSVIAITVTVHSLSAGGLARLLGLRRSEPMGWLIIGAHRLGRTVARFIADTRRTPVVLMDTNAVAVDAARAEGLEALQIDARDPEIEELLQLHGLGYLLALTDDEDLNMLLCHRWSGELDSAHLYFWARNDAEEGQTVGHAVWTRLPKPSVLSGELERGEAILTRRGADEADGDTPLVVNRDGRIDLRPQPGTLSLAAPQSALFLHREADLLGNALDAELACRCAGRTAVALFGELITVVGGRLPGRADQLLDELLQREQHMSSGIGHGVAIPHAYADVARPVCAIAQTPDTELTGPDGQPVRLVFLLVSPRDDHPGHLATLAEIARTVGDEGTRQRLLDAQEPGDMVAIIRDFSR